MTEPQFWDLVQLACDKCGSDMDARCNVIKVALSKLPPDEAVEFSRHFDAMMDKAYSWPLWGAAYVVHGGCSDDAFSDFRSSLISRGRASYERAVADPDSLADEDFDDDAWFYEGYQYAVNEGVKAAAGTVPGRAAPHPSGPSGESWEEDRVHDLFPRLTARFA
jgi:hypothetical protein